MTARIHILDVRPGPEPDGLPAKATVGEDADRLLSDDADLHERVAAGVPEREGRRPVLDAAEALRDTSRPPMARLAAALSVRRL